MGQTCPFPSFPRAAKGLFLSHIQELQEVIGGRQFQFSFLGWSSLSQCCYNLEMDLKGLQCSALLVRRNYIVVMNCNFDEV